MGGWGEGWRSSLSDGLALTLFANTVMSCRSGRGHAGLPVSAHREHAETARRQQHPQDERGVDQAGPSATASHDGGAEYPVSS